MTEESVIYIFFLKKWDQKSIWVYTPPTHFGAHNRGQANEIHPLYYAARVITKVIGKNVLFTVLWCIQRNWRDSSQGICWKNYSSVTSGVACHSAQYNWDPFWHLVPVVPSLPSCSNLVNQRLWRQFPL